MEPYTRRSLECNIQRAILAIWRIFSLFCSRLLQTKNIFLQFGVHMYLTFIKSL